MTLRERLPPERLAGGAPFGGRLPAELPALLAYTERRFGRGRALDIVQETLLNALRAEQTFDAKRPLGPWLRSVAARVAQRLAEREQRGPVALESPDTVVSEPGHPETSEHAEAVERLLAVLVPEERALVMRHHLDGESLAEIAASLGAPLGTVKARLWRARRRLALLGAALALSGVLVATIVSRREPYEHPVADRGAARLVAASARVFSAPLPRPEPSRRVPTRTSFDTWTVRRSGVDASPPSQHK